MLLAIITADNSFHATTKLFSTVACDEHKAQFSGFFEEKYLERDMLTLH